MSTAATEACSPHGARSAAKEGVAPPLLEDDAIDVFKDKLTRLSHELNESSSPCDPFTVFARFAEDMFPGLAHTSLVLFPTIKTARQEAQDGHTADAARSASAHTATRRPAAKGQQGGRHTCSHAAAASPSSPWQPTAFDWANTCMFLLSKHRNLTVLPPPDWPLVCSAALCAATVNDGLLRTNDYHAKGPHFMDWQALAAQGCASMASVPVYCWKQPVAVLTLASTATGAFASGDALVLLSAALAPHVQSLAYTTRRMEMERVVQHMLTPLAAELSVQQGRFKRIKNTSGEDVLCLDESRGLNGARASSVCALSAQANLLGSQGPSILTSKTTAAPAVAGVAKGAAGVRMMGVTDPAVLEAAEAERARDKPPQPSRRGRAPDMMDHIDLSWTDFCFNLASMVLVYAYFSKAAAHGESITAVLLCMGVAAFDILLLLMRWLWYDHYLNYGLVLCVFQVYRVFLLPFANTWMLWSLINKLEVEVTNTMWAAQAALLLLCFAFSTRIRALLHVPVQLVTVCLSASTAARTCCSSSVEPMVVACMSGIMWLQMLLSIVVPMALTHVLDAKSCRSFVPHVQAKRWVFQT